MEYAYKNPFKNAGGLEKIYLTNNAMKVEELWEKSLEKIGRDSLKSSEILNFKVKFLEKSL